MRVLNGERSIDAWFISKRKAKVPGEGQVWQEEKKVSGLESGKKWAVAAAVMVTVDIAVVEVTDSFDRDGEQEQLRNAWGPGKGSRRTFLFNNSQLGFRILEGEAVKWSPRQEGGYT